MEILIALAHQANFLLALPHLTMRRIFAHAQGIFQGQLGCKWRQAPPVRAHSLFLADSLSAVQDTDGGGTGDDGHGWRARRNWPCRGRSPLVAAAGASALSEDAPKLRILLKPSSRQGSPALVLKLAIAMFSTACTRTQPWMTYDNVTQAVDPHFMSEARVFILLHVPRLYRSPAARQSPQRPRSHHMSCTQPSTQRSRHLLSWLWPRWAPRLLHMGSGWGLACRPVS